MYETTPDLRDLISYVIFPLKKKKYWGGDRNGYLPFKRCLFFSFMAEGETSETSVLILEQIQLSTVWRLLETAWRNLRPVLDSILNPFTVLNKREGWLKSSWSDCFRNVTAVLCAYKWMCCHWKWWWYTASSSGLFVWVFFPFLPRATWPWKTPPSEHMSHKHNFL